MRAQLNATVLFSYRSGCITVGWISSSMRQTDDALEGIGIYGRVRSAGFGGGCGKHMVLPCIRHHPIRFDVGLLPARLCGGGTSLPLFATRHALER